MLRYTWRVLAARRLGTAHKTYTPVVLGSERAIPGRVTRLRSPAGTTTRMAATLLGHGRRAGAAALDGSTAPAPLASAA